MDRLLQDLRSAARQIVRAPGLTAAAALSLALGVGANTAIFSVISALLLRPLPVADPARFVTIYTSDFSGPPYGASSYPDFLDFRSRMTSLAGLTASRMEPLSLTRGEVTERIFAEVVSAEYFDVIGMPAAIGRTFTAEDARPGADPAVVVGHRFWTKQLNADPAAIGQPLTLNGHTFTIVGVASDAYRGLLRGASMDVWLTVSAEPLISPRRSVEQRGSRSYFIAGRLRPDAVLDQARAELRVLAQQLLEAHPENWRDVRGQGRHISVLPEHESRVVPQARGAVVTFLSLLLGLVGLVLLVACANVAGLVLARATARGREIAVRLSLGGTRARIVQQLATESAVVAAIGGAIGLTGALWAAGAIAAFEPPLPLPVSLDTAIDVRTLLFGLVAVTVSAIVVGLAPALNASRPDIVSALKDERARGRGRRVTLRSTLVVTQVALSLVLLVVGGLFLRSLERANAIDPGFDPQGVVSLSLDVSMMQYSSDRGRQFYTDVLERLRSTPGAAAVSLSTLIPLTLEGGRRGIAPEGYARRPGEDMEVPFNIVGPDYFATLRTQVVRGRGFDARDRAGAPRVVVVSESFAAKYWPGVDPLTRRVSLSGASGPLLDVVGVVRDTAYWTLADRSIPMVYTSFDQEYRPAATLHVRTAGDPSAMIVAARDAVRALDPKLPVLAARPLEGFMSTALLPQQFAGALLGSLGIAALLLASVGLAGVAAYFVGQRTREFGIRMALGATRRDVLALVVRQGLHLTLTGIVVGLALACAAATAAGRFLVGIGPYDAVAFGLAPLLLLVVALCACYVPARRAAGIDPMSALRHD